MKVILKTDVKKVGKAGEIVDVADGYARNYLIARGLAVPSTTKSLEILADQKKEAKKQDEANREEAKKLAEKIGSMTLVFHVNSGKEGRVFGSVSTKQIVEELRKKGISVDKRKFLDTQAIGTLGTTKVRVELYKDVIATINVRVVGND